MKAAPASLITAWVLLAPAAFAERWAMQYFYDEIKTELTLSDLAFPSARRGIAIGTIYEPLGSKPGSGKHVALITNDGGEHWTRTPLEDRPRSLFFIDESRGWMVTEDALWFTEESGRSWKKISPQIKPNRKLRPKPE